MCSFLSSLCMHGSDQLSAEAGCSCKNALPALCCISYSSHAIFRCALADWSIWRRLGRDMCGQFNLMICENHEHGGDPTNKPGWTSSMISLTSFSPILASLAGKKLTVGGQKLVTAHRVLSSCAHRSDEEIVFHKFVRPRFQQVCIGS